MLFNDDRLLASNNSSLNATKNNANPRNIFKNTAYSSNLKNSSISSSLSSASSSSASGSSTTSSGYQNQNRVYYEDLNKPLKLNYHPKISSQIQTNPKRNTISDRMLEHQVKMTPRLANNSYTASLHLQSLAPNQTSCSYTCQTYNPNRLSSYDNETFLNYQNYYDTKHEKLNTNETLPSYLINNGKYCRKRASIACTSNQTNDFLNKIPHSSAKFNNPKISSNIFNRAFNYAKKSATGSATALSTSSSINSTKNSTWKSKLGKYLQHTSSTRRKSSLKSHDQEEGCDIIIDEDFYSSYHLSRKNPINLINQQSTNANILSRKDSSQNINLVTSSSSPSASSSSQFTLSPVSASLNTNKRNQRLDKLKDESPTLNLTSSLNKLTISSGFTSLRKILKIPSYSSSSSKHGTVNRNRKNSEFLSASATPVPSCLISNCAENRKINSSNISINQANKLANLPQSISTSNSERSSIENASLKKLKKQMSFSSPITVDSIRSDIQTKNKKNMRNYHSLSLTEPNKSIVHEQNNGKKKPSSNSSISESNNKVFKIYKNVLNKIQKSPNSESNSSNSSKNSSCLNRLNTKNLLYNQLNCVKTECETQANESSSSSLFNTALRTDINFMSLSPTKNNAQTDFEEEKLLNDTVKVYDGYKSLIKQIESHKPIYNQETNFDAQFLLGQRDNSNSPVPLATEDDLICDLEVASFFDKTSRNFNVLTELNTNVFYTDYDCDQVVYECVYEQDKDEDSQNLDLLVRQLVAEASLSNLNFGVLTNSKNLEENYLVDELENDQDDLVDDLEDENSLDLDHSEFVDDDFQIGEYKKSSIISNGNCTGEESPLKSDRSEDSLVDVDVSYMHMSKPQAVLQMYSKTTPASFRKPASTRASRIEQLYFDPLTSLSELYDENRNSDSIKIEKKIRLNYRKPQNLSNLLNFGTLC